MFASILLAIGIFLIALGFILMFLSVLLPVFKGKGGTRISGGGVILIGPFPIIFGTKDITKALIAVTIAFILFMVLLSLIMTFNFQL